MKPYIPRPRPTQQTLGLSRLGEILNRTKLVTNFPLAVSPGANSNSRHKWLYRLSRDSELTGTAVKIGIQIFRLLNAKKGYAWPGYKYLARHLNMPRRSVIRAVKLLIARGWLIRTRGKQLGETNKYRLGEGPREMPSGAAEGTTSIPSPVDA